MNFDQLNEILESGSREELDAFLVANNCTINNGRIVHNDPALVNEQAAFWDKRQLVKKINLNSLYGALLNAGCRFFDQRLGQSTTLTGRSIARHMDAYINELLTGVYDHDGECILYGDTDSAYFSAWPVIQDQVEKGEIEWNIDTCIAFYDSLGEQVTASFPDFMKRAHNCPPAFGQHIAAGREVVATSGIFLTKKRYALMVIDDEGNRMDINGKPGKVKVMGLEIKRSDTPKYMQDFLTELVTSALTGATDNEIVDRVIEFKREFAAMPPWEKGTPKRVNNMTANTKKIAQDSKANISGHARAAINWNLLKKIHGDRYSMPITDGQKTIVCKLRPNPLGLTSIGFPVDEKRLPEWFKELPFDEDTMMDVIIDNKVENLLGVLNWNLKERTDTRSTFADLFSFS